MPARALSLVRTALLTPTPPAFALRDRASGAVLLDRSGSHLMPRV